jgi:hypothetical protein
MCKLYEIGKAEGHMGVRKAANLGRRENWKIHKKKTKWLLIFTILF